MVTFRNNNNNNRRQNFRRNDRNFKRNGDGPKFKSDYSSNSSFQRKVPGRNNHNASKLIEKYNDLAREALANEDKILSENYFQHADHFTRVLSEQEKNRSIKAVDDIDKNVPTVKIEEKKEVINTKKDETEKKTISN
ncbi:DUF4167 domain-containing protein [Candidatus Pelagibacter sp.]|jgi:hypothetical protein|nr:DUF4167 domain-containing protein [Candidatus Pelagibacter sp.]|tara:strand:+ start:145 stop:555 length:411 start_codon:yes stop_codon:yes gene_type:complete